MPNWLTVNETNTPTTYIWINWVTEALKAITRPAAANARVMMPLEYARRSPRVCNCRGRKLSRARIEPSTGKPLNAVLAARNKMIIVAVITK